MDSMEWLKAAWQSHRFKVLATIAAIVLLPPVASTLTGSDELDVVANAQPGEAMTVAVQTDRGLLSDCGGEAEVTIIRDGIHVYTGPLANVPMDGCEGEAEIPYRLFVDRNAPYDVNVEYEDRSATTHVTIDKIVNWVYVRAFNDEDEEQTRIEFALSKAQAQPLTSGVITTGRLDVDIRFERCSETNIEDLLSDVTGDPACPTTEGRHVYYTEVPVEDRAASYVTIPWDALDPNGEDEPQEGWYNVTATFHNDQALANKNVPMDPTVYNEDPPAPWFEVEY